MSEIKKVTLAGATGNLGPAILTSLLESKLFDVTVLSRKESTHIFPAGVTVKQVDYTSESSLAAALHGQDAVISTLAFVAFEAQKLLIDVAVRAGVQRFLPTEFGSNSTNPNVAAIPIFATKVQTQAYLKQKAAEVPSFSYTFVFNGPFLDWNLAIGMLVDVKGKKAELVDGGNAVFSATRLQTVGQGVVGILSHAKETANRVVMFKDIDVTQNQIIAIAKELDPSGEWAITHVTSETQHKEALDGFAKGQVDLGVITRFLFRAIYGEGYGGKLEPVDNKLLGLKGLDEAGLKDLVKSILGL